MAEEISLNRYFSGLWRAKWIIIGVSILASGITWFYSRRQPAKYNALAVLQVGKVWKDQIEDPYVTADTINSPGFAHALAPALGMKPGQLRKSLHAETVTAGPARSSYPILVRITTTTASSPESLKLADAVSKEVIRRHNAMFDQSLAPHLVYQQSLEALLDQAGVRSTAKPQNDELSHSRTPFENAHPPSDSVIKLERELQDVVTANTAPTYTERTHLVDNVVASGTVVPEVLRPTVTAGIIALILTAVVSLIVQSLSGFPSQIPDSKDVSKSRAGVREEEVQP